MVTRGKIRSNGYQLANYLLKTADNDNVRVLEIKGTSQTDNLKKSLLEMSVTSELTRSNAGLYHAQICPAYKDRQMDDRDWIRAAEIMEAELAFEGQKRAIVLHDKNQKTHAHVVWERFDHEKNIMKSNKHSRLAQDRARIKMEAEFEHKKTPTRNEHREHMKAELFMLWQKTNNAVDFLSMAEGQGYRIAAGTQRPYMVIDKNGRSFDLVRQLEGVKTKEVRERFAATQLIKEKKVIELIRQKQNDLLKQQHNKELNKTFTSKDIKTQRLDYSINVRFDVKKSNELIAAKQLEQTLKLSEEKERKKQALKDELVRARLERARRFRENERDL